MKITFPIKFEEKLKDEVKTFIELAIARVHTLDNLLSEEKNDELRLYYLKELYSICTEFEAIQGIDNYKDIANADITLAIKYFKFIRNIFAHFPIFNNWKEIWISETLAINMTAGYSSIATFMSKNKNSEEKKFEFVTLQKDGSQKTFETVLKTFNYKNPNDKIYLNDIVTFDGALHLVILMYNLLVQKFDWIK